MTGMRVVLAAFGDGRFTHRIVDVESSRRACPSARTDSDPICCGTRRPHGRQQICADPGAQEATGAQPSVAESPPDCDLGVARLWSTDAVSVSDPDTCSSTTRTLLSLLLRGRLASCVSSSFWPKVAKWMARLNCSAISRSDETARRRTWKNALSRLSPQTAINERLLGHI